jgi:hypothetical protein
VTEAEWLAENHLYRMLMFVHPHWTPRASRLFGAGCCRQVWELITAPALRKAIEVSEQFADGAVTVDARRRAARSARAAASELAAAAPTNTPRAAWAERMVAEAVVEVVGNQPSPSQVATRVEQATTANRGEPTDLAVPLRDIFGNPFRPPVAFEVSWRTDTVLAIAKQMYASRDFSGMPILADALQDAGCDNDDILSHCRGATLTHVRGCWVVDLVLNQG